MKTSKITSERKKKISRHDTSTGAFCNGNGASDSGLRTSEKHDAGGATGTSPSAKHDAVSQSLAALPEVRSLTPEARDSGDDALIASLESQIAMLKAEGNRG